MKKFFKFMGVCLIFAGEIQVNIRHLVAAEAEEGFKRDVEAVLIQLFPAFGAVPIRQIRAAGAPITRRRRI